tara:strand:+ start:103 stop:405 length:303 start_codon:yes stop_codon:yes gene_type:complete
MKLSKDDYIKILNFYRINYNTNNLNIIKRKAEDILAVKLCRCIKKVKKSSDKNESRSIGICKNSVLNRKNLSVGKFSCKKRPRFLKDNNNRSTLKKIKRY